jgi:hypothetical protein
MSADEEACYSARYFDIPANMSANEHYARVGEKQGRNIRCTYFMTHTEAHRYLGRYPSLGNEFGREGKDAYLEAKEHWYTNGSKSTPKLQNSVNYEEEEPYKCGDYGDECQCRGRVHFGLKYREDSNTTDISTLHEMLEFKQGVKYEGRGKVTTARCKKQNFKNKHGKLSAFLKGKEEDQLQCFCEPDPVPEPFHCSHEGETCQCPGGNVFFGERYNVGASTIMSFRTMLEHEWTVAKAPTGGNVNCTPSSFVGGNPEPGYDMDCYCDQHNVVSQAEVNDQIYYWEGVIEEELAMEAEAKAEAEAEAARAAAAEENARLKAELAAAEERIKQAQANFLAQQ